MNISCKKATMIKEIPLEHFSRGNIIAWNVMTQSAAETHVKLSYGGNALFSVSKTSASQNLEFIERGSTILGNGDKVVLGIAIPQSKEIKSKIVSGEVTDDSGKRAGYVYDIFIEDCGDGDYNDVYINIVGWTRIG